MFIQTEPTPNPATLKFLPGREVAGSRLAEFRSAAEAQTSPLASALFTVDGVSQVFLGGDFISVTKGAGEWQHLKPSILGVIMEHFVSGAPLFVDGGSPQAEDDEFYEAAIPTRSSRSRNCSIRACVRRWPAMAATSSFAASRTASSISR